MQSFIHTISIVNFVTFTFFFALYSYDADDDAEKGHTDFVHTRCTIFTLNKTYMWFELKRDRIFNQFNDDCWEVTLSLSFTQCKGKVFGLDSIWINFRNGLKQLDSAWNVKKTRFRCIFWNTPINARLLIFTALYSDIHPLSVLSVKDKHFYVFFRIKH